MRSAFRFGMAVGLLVLGCGGGTTSNITAGSMPENGSFSGVYFSPQYGEMHLVQNGNAVVGEFKKDERSGKIQGEAEGDVLRFEWIEYKAMVSNRPQEARGKGHFRYMIDASNGDHVLKGRWGLNDDDTSGGEWNAYKSRSRQPDLEGFGGPESTSGGESEGEGGEDTSMEESSGDSGESGEEESGDDIF
jgi:hypothetical protein